MGYVFFCDQCVTCLIKTEKEFSCPICKNPMENIGHVDEEE